MTTVPADLYEGLRGMGVEITTYDRASSLAGTLNKQQGRSNSDRWDVRALWVMGEPRYVVARGLGYDSETGVVYLLRNGGTMEIRRRPA